MSGYFSIDLRVNRDLLSVSRVTFTLGGKTRETDMDGADDKNDYTFPIVNE